MSDLASPKLQPQPTPRFDLELFERRVRDYALSHSGRKIRILEAGCGRQWNVDLTGLDMHLTGIDINAESVRIRMAEAGDLDDAIVGDLREVDLSADSYDIVFSSFVLEHVAGAEQLLDRLVAAVRPGGLLLLRVPDRDSVFAFLTRRSPHWVHVQYWRRIRHIELAGKPGQGPFPVVYDRIVSWRGITAYCQRHGLQIVDAYSSNFFLGSFGSRAAIVDHMLRSLALLSFGRLTADHNNLAFVIRKPPTEQA